MKQQYPQRLRRPLATLALFAALSLPALAVNTSLSSDGASVSGAINDGLFYSIGGGSVISPPPSRSNMSRLGAERRLEQRSHVRQLRPENDRGKSA